MLAFFSRYLYKEPLNKMNPILISIAHSSTFVPYEIRKLMAMTDFEIKRSSDLYTEQIYDIRGCYKVLAKISRLVCDVNRAPDDIEMESELMSEGVVVRISEDGKLLYKEPPSPEMIHRRIAMFHNGFHEEIDKYIDRMKFLIDGHSMCAVGPLMKHDAGKERPEICLGNRGYSTCDYKITRFFFEAFKDFGYSVSINKPYSGHYILGYHCSRRRTMGIQIEINRKLYMDEKTLKPFKLKIKLLNEQITDIVGRLLDVF